MRHAKTATALALETSSASEADAWPRVLIADDEPDVLQLLMWLIEMAYPRAVVRTARDGVHAFQELTDFKPDLLVADLVMPRYDGAFLCRLARNSEELGPLKILGISGRDDADTRRMFLESGAGAFVAKPVDFGQLQRALRRLLGPPPGPSRDRP